MRTFWISPVAAVLIVALAVTPVAATIQEAGPHDLSSGNVTPH